MPQHVNEYTDARTGTVTRTEVPWTVDSAKERIKELRYAREIAGVIVGGVPISTERGDHRNTMLSLSLAGVQNPDMQVPFKLADGSFTVLSGAFAVVAWQCGTSYVAQCFAVESEAAAAIEAAASDSEIDAILAGLKWPEQTFEVSE